MKTLSPMKKLIAILMIALFLTGCASTETPAQQPSDSGGMTKLSYLQIDQETAKQKMEADDGHVIVDVRRQDEYDAGHIPGAILIPNESIITERPEELPDLNQVILIYCRSGNRSKQAAQKLADMGYVNLYEFGGIIDWTGDIVTGNEKATLSFDSFDGGGPEYSILLGEDIVSYEQQREYSSPDHEDLDGASYDVTFTFAGLKPGETTMTVQQRSPIAGNMDHIYSVKVDPNLNVTIEALTVEDLDMAVVSVPTLVIETPKKTFYAALEDNSSAREFAEKLSAEVIEVEMHDYGSFEKVGSLPWSLERNDESITTEPGDVILYQGNQITIYYDQNTWNFTKLATIGNVTKEELLDALGEGNVTVTFWVEWSE